MSESSPPQESRDDSPSSETPKEVKKEEKKKGNYKGKKPWFKSGTGPGTSASTVKKIAHVGLKEMNGHIFTCHGETMNTTQFKRTCEELERYCTVHMKSYGDDMARIVRKMETEVVKQPSDPGATATNLRQKIFDKEIDIYVKRLDAYHLNTRILYNVIWSQCSEPMRSKLKLSDSFDDIESNRNALALLKEVQRVSSNFSTQRYVCLALYDAIQSFYRVHQAKDQPASDYLSKFKVLYQSIKHYGGTIGEDPILVREEIRRAGVVMPESYDRGDIIFDLYLTPATCKAALSSIHVSKRS